MEEWKGGREEDWKGGRMEEWKGKSRRGEEWKSGRLEGGRMEGRFVYIALRWSAATCSTFYYRYIAPLEQRGTLLTGQGSPHARGVIYL